MAQYTLQGFSGQTTLETQDPPSVLIERMQELMPLGCKETAAADQIGLSCDVSSHRERLEQQQVHADDLIAGNPGRG